MEILELELGEFSRRIRSVVVSHHSTTLTRGLDYGETVLVHDAAGEVLLGCVAEISFGYTDTYYRLELRAEAPVPLEVTDIVAMLHDLPGSDHRDDRRDDHRRLHSA